MWDEQKCDSFTPIDITDFSCVYQRRHKTHLDDNDQFLKKNHEFYKARISQRHCFIFYFQWLTDLCANQIPKVKYNFVEDVIWIIWKEWEQILQTFWFPLQVEGKVVMHLIMHIRYACILSWTNYLNLCIYINVYRYHLSKLV